MTSCPRCESCSDADLALARAMGPLIQTATKAYLSGRPLTEMVEPPPELTRTQEKLFSILFQASPEVVRHEVLFYSLGGTVKGLHSLRVIMSDLRLKLAREYRIDPVYGVGYRMLWETNGG